MAGLGLSVGGSAAGGLEAGFDMGLRATAAEDRRKQTEFENARQTAADTERTSQTARTNARQDKQDQYAEDDRALAGVNSEMQDQALTGAGLAAQYGGASKIPADVGAQYAAKSNEIGTRRAQLLQKRYAPQVQAEQQWAKDTSSRIATGQMSMDDLSPADTVRLIQATTRRPVSDFIASDGGKSRVGQAIDDTTAGIQTKNQPLMIQGANSLLAPELQTGLGHVTRDGAQVTGKSLYALVPAPQQMLPPGQQASVQPSNPIQGLTAALNAATAPPQPAQGAPGAPQPDDGSGGLPPGAPAQTSPVASSGAPQQLTPGQSPGAVLPVLQVTAQHPDGTEVQYHAPVTSGRGTGADETISPPMQVGDMMERMGKLGTLEQWMNTPQAKAKIQAGLDELGPKSNSFLSSYYAMHGDAKALLPPGSEDPTSKKIAAIQKLADTSFGGDFAAAAQAEAGKGKGITGAIASKLQAIEDSDLSDEDKAKATKIALMGASGAGVTGAGGKKPPSGYEYTPEGELKFIKGGPADPAVKGGNLGARESVFINRVLLSANEAAKDLSNVVQLPLTASTGLFGGRKQGGSLFDAGKEALTNKMTSQEVQSYNVMATGFHRALASIEAAGLAPSGQLSNAMDAIIFKEGDTNLTRLQKLAQTRQIIEAGLETTLSNPKIPDEQRQHINDVIRTVQKAVPFTQNDVVKLQSIQTDNPNATLKDVLKQVKRAPAGGVGGSGAAPAAAGGAPRSITSDDEYNALPSGTRFIGPDGQARRKP